MKKRINIGIQLLRMILCFWVVCYHCLRVRNKIICNIIFRKVFHVPTFMFISFYYLFDNLYKRNINKIKNRFIRLLIPYLIWPILIWIINNLLIVSIKFNRFNRFLSLYDLYIQFLIGRSFHAVFWFLFNLIFLTNFYIIISFIFKKNFLFILLLFGIFSYILQYSNYNYNIFKLYDERIFCSLGYICEIIPITISGLLFASLKINKKIETHRKKTIITSILILYCLFKYNIFSDLKGFTYRGILLNFGSIFLFVCFSLISFDKIKNKSIIIIVDYITSYTNGIYCLHIIISDYLAFIFSFIKKKTLNGCIIIYLFSFFISFIGKNIFKKGVLKYLFI